MLFVSIIPTKEATVPTITTAQQIVDRVTAIVAATPCELQSSADLCAAEARELLRAGKTQLAMRRALRALSYSVGVYHADYAAIADAMIEINYQADVCGAC